MEKYIDTERIKRHKIITHYPGDYHNGWNDAIDEILEDEPADVQEVKHGVWIDTEAYTNHYGHIYECSNCHKEVADDFIVKHTYCLHCGAKMDGKENEK